MALLILLLALLPRPIAEPIKPPPGLPPFDPDKSFYTGYFICDPNWCLVRNDIGFPRHDAQDPAVREFASQLGIFDKVYVPLPQGWKPYRKDLIDYIAIDLFDYVKEEIIGFGKDTQVQEKQEDLPPFDPSRAVRTPDGKMWCDPNWCIFDPETNPHLYGRGGCHALCGMPRLSDAEDPRVRDWNLVQKLAGKGELAHWMLQPGLFRDTPWIMFGPQFASCPPDHQLCKGIIPPVVDRGPGPGGGPGSGGGGGDRNPPGGADSCPAPEVIRFDPAWRIRSWPPNPVVVGQDPRREGIVYEIEVRIPPVIYRRYEKEPDRCEPVPDADGDGKPDRSGSCWTQIGDPPVRWPGDLKPGECRLVEERYPEPVEGQGALAMTLRRSSIEWIQGELAARYPGARVRMPRIMVPVQGQGTVLADKTFVLAARVNPKPVDPGFYDVEIAFNTAGTPVTAPRRIEWRTPPDRPQPVYLLETTLVR